MFAEFASVARALGHPHRLEILEHLAQGERGVEALSERIGLTVANTSQHLQMLKRSGLVEARRSGKFIHYRMADTAILGVTTGLQHIAERNIAQVDKIVRSYFNERDSLEPVSRAELLARSQNGEVTVLDVRPADEFTMGHVAGAISIPLKELEARLAQLDPAKEIIAYCRGAYCVLSFEAVALLRKRGFRAKRLEDGFPEWKAAGFSTDEANRGSLPITN